MQPEFNLAEGQRLKEEGMSSVVEDQVWEELFRDKGYHIAVSGSPFTSEDIVQQIGLPPKSRNAVGAAMNALARSLGLKRVGFRQAKRPSRHAAIVAVWQLPN